MDFFLPVPLAASLVQPVISSVVKAISIRGVGGAGADIWIKIFSSAPSFNQYQDILNIYPEYILNTKYFNYEPKFHFINFIS